MKPLRVVIIESSELQIASLERAMRSFFNRCGYEPEFRSGTSEKQARTFVEEFSPHVIVCDLSFNDSNLGLVIIRSLKREYPDIYVICASKTELKSREVIAKRASFDQFLDKVQIVSASKGGVAEDYIKFNANYFLNHFRKNTSFEIEFEGAPSLAQYKSRLERREIQAIFEQITFVDHDSDDQLTPTTGRLTALAGGLSGSSVVRLDAVNAKTGIQSVPAVVKISELEYAQREVRNYNRYVKWGLPYMWRVDVLGCGFSRKLGAVAYSFVLSGDNSFNSLTELLHDEKYPQVEEVIKKLFSPKLRRWYGEELTRQEENINSRYIDRYFRGVESQAISEAKFRQIVEKAFHASFNNSHFSLFGKHYWRPIEKLFGTENGGYSSCVCHGDLNSNNVIVADNDQVILIDFQETGRGHVFEDFVAMEAAIRLYAPQDAERDWQRWLEQEAAIAEGSDSSTLGPAMRLIAQIRRLAIQNFPNEPFANYHYAVAAYNFRLLRAKLSDDQARKCCSAIVAALEHLERETG